MPEILIFDKSHVEKAKKLAIMNYNLERAIVPALPQIHNIPDLASSAENGLGVAMFDGDEMLGFLCCHKPWDNAFNSTARGTFVPLYAHGAVRENREMIYKKLYQAAAKEWVNQKITYHTISLYAHDSQVLNAFFTNGFGLRCVDAVRELETIECCLCTDTGIIFEELPKADVIKVRELRHKLNEHLSESPCFMRFSPERLDQWLKSVESRDSRIYAAMNNDEPVAFIEVRKSGETFAAEAKSMMNIGNTFCLPEYRGKDVIQGLLNHVIMVLKAEGYESVGVDFESFNPAAHGFWLKYFTAYSNSVARRIDECVLRY